MCYKKRLTIKILKISAQKPYSPSLLALSFSKVEIILFCWQFAIANIWLDKWHSKIRDKRSCTFHFERRDRNNYLECNSSNDDWPGYNETRLCSFNTPSNQLQPSISIKTAKFLSNYFLSSQISLYSTQSHYGPYEIPLGLFDKNPLINTRKYRCNTWKFMNKLNKLK